MHKTKQKKNHEEEMFVGQLSENRGQLDVSNSTRSQEY